jgi:prepilin-type N-terminal cleavage/methylation domain-containing protein
MSLKKLSSKGFTLIELMIVVAIIGILAAVAIPKFADLVTKSKEASCKGSLGSVRSAVSIYYGDAEGVYPDNLFVGLTTGDKYLPSQTGLGNFTVPVNKLGNPGHTSAITLASGVAQATNNTVTDAAGLHYNTTNGDVLIACTHNDTKGTAWTGY